MTAFVRRLDANNDPIIGRGVASFLYGADSVPQRLKTRLRVILGEWFLDTSDGVPWWALDTSDTQPIMGVPKNLPYAEATLKARILATDGVAALVAFSMEFDSTVRRLSISFTVTPSDGGDTITIEGITPPAPTAAPAGSFSMAGLLTVQFASMLRTYPVAALVTGQALARALDAKANYWLQDNTGNPDDLDPPGEGQYINAADGRQWVRE